MTTRRKLVPKDVHDRTLELREIEETIKLYQDSILEKQMIAESLEEPYKQALLVYEDAQAKLKEAGANLSDAKLALQRTQATLDKFQRLKLNERGGLLFQKEILQAISTEVTVDLPRESQRGKRKNFAWQEKAIEALALTQKFMDVDKLFSAILSNCPSYKQSLANMEAGQREKLIVKTKENLVNAAQRNDYARKEKPLAYYMGLIGLPSWMDSNGTPNAKYIAFTGGSPVMKSIEPTN